MKKYNYRGIKLNIPDEHFKHSINMSLHERFTKNVYEKDEIDNILKYIDDKSVVLDLGGSLGVLSWIVAKNMEDIDNKSSNLVTVEANPKLVDTITNNRDINNLNFNISQSAISYNNRLVNFNFNGLSHSGSIFKKTHLIGKQKEKMYGTYENVSIETKTPIDIEKIFNLKFNTLSCDIEGEEYDLLYYMFDYFKDYSTMVVELHDSINDSKFTFKDIIKLYDENFNITKHKNIAIFRNKIIK